MSVKFFGQFLIEQGEIDAGQLRQALDEMASRNLELGALAVRSGLITPDDTRRVQHEQRRRDAPFGEIAVELGLLTSAQVQQLLADQRRNRMRLGEALVHLGHLTTERLPMLVDAFKSDQSQYDVSIGDLLPPDLASLRTAAISLDLVVKLALRMSRVHIKLGTPSNFVTCDRPVYCASLWIRGDEPLGLWIMSDAELAEKLAGGVTKLSNGATREMVEDALGEFLNLVGGNAIALLERQQVRCELDPPRFGLVPTGGHAFDLVTSCGSGTIVLVQ